MRFVCLSIAIFSLYTGPVSSSRLFGDFAGSELLIDSQVESPASFQGSTTAVSPAAGQQIQFQLFVPQAAGGTTLGFNLEFSASGLEFLQFFAIAGVDFNGAPLVITNGEPVASAILIARPTYPSNGHIATITLTALQDVPVGTVISFVNQTAIADENSGKDILDISRASLTLIEENYVAAIPGDLNLDGSVDFSDFLTFASNFGSSGPVPSPPRSHTIILRDTVFVVSDASIDTVVLTRTVHDTILQTRTITVRDTIFFPTGGTETPRPPIREWNEVVSDIRKATYWLGVTTTRPGDDIIFIGTGFAVLGDLLATNYHVSTAANTVTTFLKAGGAEPVYVAIRADGRPDTESMFKLRLSDDDGRVLGHWHPGYDFTVNSPDVMFCIPAEEETKMFDDFLTLVPMREAKGIDVGDEIATLGFPGELEVASSRFSITATPTFKTGTVSALRAYDPSRTFGNPLGRIGNRIVQHDFNVSPGTSGSPIFNRRGEVVAINNAGSTQEASLGFAIRADELREMIQAVAVEFGLELINSKPSVPKTAK